MSLPTSHIVVSSSSPIFSAVTTFPQATVVASNPTMLQVVGQLSAGGGTLMTPVVARRTTQPKTLAASPATVVGHLPSTSVAGAIGSTALAITSASSASSSSSPHLPQTISTSTVSSSAKLPNSCPQVVTVPVGQLHSSPMRPIAAAGATSPAVVNSPAAPPATPDRRSPAVVIPKSELSAATTNNANSTTTTSHPLSAGASNNNAAGVSGSGSSGVGNNTTTTATATNNSHKSGGAGSSNSRQQDRTRQDRADREKDKDSKGSKEHEQENRPDDKQILNREKLTELVKEVDPMQQLDEDVESVLLQMADDFIESVVSSSCLLAKHRKSQLLEAKDVSVILERQHNLYIPGFSGDDLHTYKKTPTSEAHRQRLALIRKTLKKF